MGIESQYLGEINIPEEHRAEYAQQALKLLRAGGMVKWNRYSYRTQAVSAFAAGTGRGGQGRWPLQLSGRKRRREVVSQRKRGMVRLRQDHWKLLLFHSRRRAYFNNALEHILCRNAHRRLSGAGKALYQMDQLCAGHTIYEPSGDAAMGDRQAASAGQWLLGTSQPGPRLSAGGLSTRVCGPGPNFGVSGCLPL